MVTRAVAGIWIALLSGLLVACGGGTSGTPVAEGGIGGTGIAPITGFGSVFVGGVEYDTTNAVITVDGQTCNGCRDSDVLGVGMVVKVVGTVNPDGVTGTAQSVEYNKSLLGPVVEANVAANGIGFFTVLGQTVNVDANTVFDYGTSGYAAPTDIPQDQDVLVQVSGYADGSGTIYATRVEVVGSWVSGDDVELKGTISGLNTQANTFVVGGLVVNYSGVSDQGAISAGNYVSVKGSSFDQYATLMASSVEQEGDGSVDFGEDEDEAKVQGIITAALSGSVFMLNGAPVRLTDSVRYSNGDQATLSVIGTAAEVEGSVSGGELLAREIKFRVSSDAYYKMDSTVSQINVSGSSCYMGDISVLGQSIAVTTSTTLKDDVSEDPYFNLCDVEAALEGSSPAYVELRVYDSNGSWVASKLELKEYEGAGNDEIEGTISAVNGSQITIAGVIVELGTVASLNVGDRIEVQGTYANGILTAAQFEQED